MTPAYIVSKEVIEQREQIWENLFSKIENSYTFDEDVEICDLGMKTPTYSTDNSVVKKMKPKRRNHRVKLGHSQVNRRYKKMNARNKSKRQHGIKWKEMYKKFSNNASNNNFNSNKQPENLEGNEDDVDVEQHKHKTNVYENPRTCTKNIKEKEVFVKINNLDIDLREYLHSCPAQNNELINDEYTNTEHIDEKEMFNKRKQRIENNKQTDEYSNVDNILNTKISYTKAKNKVKTLKNTNIDNIVTKIKQKNLTNKNIDNKDNTQTETIINEDNIKEVNDENTNIDNIDTIRNHSQCVKDNNRNIDNVDNKEKLNNAKKSTKNIVIQVKDEYIDSINKKEIPKTTSTNNIKKEQQTSTLNNIVQIKDEYSNIDNIFNTKISGTKTKNKVKPLTNKNIDKVDKKNKQLRDEYKNTHNKENTQTETIIDKDTNGRLSKSETRITNNIKEMNDEHTNIDNIDTEKNNFQNVKNNNTNTDNVDNKENLNKRLKCTKNNVKRVKDENIDNINKKEIRKTSTNNMKTDTCTNIVDKHKIEQPGSSTAIIQLKNEFINIDNVKNVHSSTENNSEQVIVEDSNDDNIDNNKTSRTDTINNNEQENDKHTITHIKSNKKRPHKRKKDFIGNHSTKKRKLTNINIVTDSKQPNIHVLNGETLTFYHFEDLLKNNCKSHNRAFLNVRCLGDDLSGKEKIHHPPAP